MASTRINVALQKELDISAKISNLESRASNLETEFSTLSQSARNLLLSTKRYIEHMEIESKSWDLLETILESENNSRQILDYLKIFFNFLLGRLQRYDAEIVDLYMLWVLLDTEDINRLFLDAIVGFGFKRKDAKNVKLLLAVVCKDQKERMDNECESPRKSTQKAENEHKGIGDTAHNRAHINAETCIIALEAGKHIATELRSEVAEPLHDHSVDQILKSWEANEGINIFGMDEQLRRVLKRMIAVVIFTLNIGKKTVTGLYDTKTDKEDRDERDNDSMKNDDPSDLADTATNTGEEVTTKLSSTDNSQEATSKGEVSDSHNNLRDRNNNAANRDSGKQDMQLASNLGLTSGKDDVLAITGEKSIVGCRGESDSKGLVSENIQDDLFADDSKNKTNGRTSTTSETIFDVETEYDLQVKNYTDRSIFEILSEDDDIGLLEKTICEGILQDDVIDQLEAFLSLG